MNGGIYNGCRILADSTVKAMTSLPGNALARFGRTPGWDMSPNTSFRGNGFGKNTYGHTGYTGTSVVIDPDSRIAVILLTNRVHPADKGSVTRLRADVANAIAGGLH
jgi:CubicO group peptidase (beta-lactamase class C family)